MTQKTTLRISENQVCLELDSKARILTRFENMSATDIGEVLTKLDSPLSSSLAESFEVSYVSSKNLSSFDRTSVTAKNEGILEIIESFSKHIAETLGVEKNASFLEKDSAIRARLIAQKNTKYDPSITVDILDHAQHWLKESTPLFQKLHDRLKEVSQPTISKERLLRLEEMTDESTLKALAQTVRDCPQFALNPRLNGHRILGACARNLRGVAKSFSIAELFSTRIDEVRRICEGKKVTLGQIIAKPIAANLAVAITETSLGLMFTFTESRANEVVWTQSILPQAWTEQEESVITEYVYQDFLKHRAKPDFVKENARLIMNAFGCFLPVEIILETNA